MSITLLEASLSRIWNHYKSNDFAILTSWKQYRDAKDNNEIFKRLKDSIKSLKLSYIVLNGVGMETDTETGKEVQVVEPSVFIPNIIFDNYNKLETLNKGYSFEDFQDKMIELGLIDPQNPQTAIIVHNNQLAETYLINPENKSVIETFRGIHFDKVAKYYSQIRGGKNRQFTFESIKFNNSPSNWVEGLGRTVSGENLTFCLLSEKIFDKQISEMSNYLNPKPSITNPNVILTEEGNPLSAIDKWNKKPVVKFAYLPSSNILLYSSPGDNHASAIHRAGDTGNFDKYVRVIYDPSKNTMGSRTWGVIDNDEDKVRSYEEQYKAFEYFSRFNPNLKWIFNLTNDDLDSVEYLDTSKIRKNRIRTRESIVESRINKWESEIQEWKTKKE